MLLQSLVGSPLGPENIEGTTSIPQKTDVNHRALRVSG